MIDIDRYPRTPLSLSLETVQWVLDNIPPGPLLEIGGGASTPLWLAAGYDICSIENDPKWAAIGGPGTELVPLVDGWYSPDILGSIVKAKRWHAVIIDGPSPRKGHRIKYLDHYLAMGLADVPTIIDDTRTVGRTDGYTDPEAIAIVEALMARPNSRRIDISRSTVILPIPPSVEVFVDGGLANRLSQMVAAPIAAERAGMPVLLHWPITKHMQATPHDLYHLPYPCIVYRDHRQFLVAATAHSEAHPQHHHGIPGRFLVNIPACDAQAAAKVIRGLRPSPAVAARVIDLRHKVDAYAVRTLSPGSPTELINIPPGSFLTTDSLQQKLHSPLTINLQTVFGSTDYDCQRSVEGMIEAAADWHTMLTARSIIYTNPRSSFTRLHEQSGIVPREKFTGRKWVGKATIGAILPPSVLDSRLFAALSSYIKARVDIEITAMSTREDYNLNIRRFTNVLTWGVKWPNSAYTRGGRNVLFCENGLLNQESGMYCDHLGYFGHSSLVIERHNIIDPTDAEVDNVKAHVARLYPEVPNQGYILVCLQMNGDAPLRHYFPAATGRTDRTATFLRLLTEHLHDRDVVIRKHPKGDLPNIPLPSIWRLDTEPDFARSLMASAAVVTVNSTCASEAIAVGKPVAVFGGGAYDGSPTYLDCRHNPAAVGGLRDFLPRGGVAYSAAILRHQLPYAAVDYPAVFDSCEPLQIFLSRLREGTVDPPSLVKWPEAGYSNLNHH